MALPERLYVNAFTGSSDPGSALDSAAGRWIGQTIAQAAGALRPPKPVSPGNWRHPDVGWGLVLPENGNLSKEARATAKDAPDSIQELVAERGGPVFRWSPELPRGKLRRYETDGRVYDPDIVSSPRGVGSGRLPRYLLMYGGPDVLPWDLQYRLSTVAFTGRLDIEGVALERYVSALRNEWLDAGSVPARAVIWAVDHGDADITHLMRGTLAYRLNAKMAADTDLDVQFFDGATVPVTHQQLIAALSSSKPGLIVTSSHGMTGPLANPAKMRAQLGLPVDALQQPLPLEPLLAAWQPDGAIWHAQACCSAGGDAQSTYTGLVQAGSHADVVLKAVAALGAMTAPLPRALLGAERPLRAFIGHVEPTFDWTLRDPSTGQVRTAALIDALYNRLYQPEPVGYAFEECHAQGPRLDMIHKQAKTDFNLGGDTLDSALAARLVAEDLESMVILGDPTVALAF